MVFGGSQVLMDLEPLIRIYRNDSYLLHGYSHTLGGALLIGTLAGLLGRPISEYVLRLLQVPHYPITWPVSFGTAYVGTFSHVLFDGMMHADMRPWWPFSDANQLLNIIHMHSIYVGCVVLGIVGAGAVCIRLVAHGRT